MFSGVLNSKFGYDDYDSTFSNVVIMDGLHCLIKYHLNGLEVEYEESFGQERRGRAKNRPLTQITTSDSADAY